MDISRGSPSTSGGRLEPSGLIEVYPDYQMDHCSLNHWMPSLSAENYNRQLVEAFIYILGVVLWYALLLWMLFVIHNLAYQTFAKCSIEQDRFTQNTLVYLYQTG